MRKRDDGSEQVVNSEGYERSAKQIQGNENYIQWTDNRNKDEDTRIMELRIKMKRVCILTVLLLIVYLFV